MNRGAVCEIPSSSYPEGRVRLATVTEDEYIQPTTGGNHNAMPIVTTHFGPMPIDKTPYWHLVGQSGPDAFMFYNNVRVNKGCLFSVSAMVANGLYGAVTPYSVAHRDRKKEHQFERVRVESYAVLPTRMGALFVFDDRAHVAHAQQTWFTGTPTNVYECRLFASSVRHKADSILLNTEAPDWDGNAHRYWQGQMTEQPLPEIIVFGGVYFPDWQSFLNDVAP